jgi:hypothetical protein
MNRIFANVRAAMLVAAPLLAAGCLEPEAAILDGSGTRADNPDVVHGYLKSISEGKLHYSTGPSSELEAVISKAVGVEAWNRNPRVIAFAELEKIIKDAAERQRSARPAQAALLPYAELWTHKRSGGTTVVSGIYLKPSPAWTDQGALNLWQQESHRRENVYLLELDASSNRRWFAVPTATTVVDRRQRPHRVIETLGEAAAALHNRWLHAEVHGSYAYGHDSVDSVALIDEPGDEVLITKVVPLKLSEDRTIFRIDYRDAQGKEASGYTALDMFFRDKRASNSAHILYEWPSRLSSLLSQPSHALVRVEVQSQPEPVHVFRSITLIDPPDIVQ